MQWFREKMGENRVRFRVPSDVVERVALSALGWPGLDVVARVDGSMAVVDVMCGEGDSYRQCLRSYLSDIGVGRIDQWPTLEEDLKAGRISQDLYNSWKRSIGRRVTGV